jgi:AcrR family transcriptional regulator
MEDSTAGADARPDVPARRQAHTPQRILEAALELFIAKGYHATSMRQIARRARVTPAAIYNHFRSKERIFLQVFRENVPLRVLIEVVDSAQGDTVEDLLQDVVRRWSGAMVGKVDRLRLVFVELLEFQGRHVPTLAPEFVPRAMGFAARLSRAGGRLRPIRPTIIVRAIGGLLMSYAITQQFFARVPEFGDDPDVLDGLGDILLHGLVDTSSAGSQP